MSEPIAFALFLIRLDYLLCSFCDLESNGMLFVRLISRFELNVRTLEIRMSV